VTTILVPNSETKLTRCEIELALSCPDDAIAFRSGGSPAAPAASRDQE
jgi:hypothetical protein